MMKKSKRFILCAVITVMTIFAVGCGNSGTDNGANNGMNNGTEAPYQDETNRKVNDGLEGAGRNLMDSMQETGDALRDGIDNLGNDVNDTNNMNRSDDANNTNNTGNTNNANNANNAGGMNMSR